MGGSSDIAELYGMHAGDGTLYRTNTGVVWELRGNLDEREFYDTVVIPLLARTGVQTMVRWRAGGPHGCIGVRCCNREFHKLLVDGGFPIGKKTHSVCIPQSVQNGNAEFRSAFLRGLFSTDGTIYLARINGQSEATYPIIEFCSVSISLRDGVVELLSDFGIKAKVWSRTPRLRGGLAHHLRIAGHRKVRAFIAHVGFSNPKHQRVAERIRNV